MVLLYEHIWIAYMDIYLLSIHLKVQGHRACRYSAFIDTTKWFSKVDAPIYHPVSSV